MDLPADLIKLHEGRVTDAIVQLNQIGLKMNWSWVTLPG